MNSTVKIFSIIFLITFFFISCHLLNKSTGTNEKNWWVGNHFTNELPVSNNPLEGGPDFLIINKDNTGEYKIGDIIQIINWKQTENKLIINNIQSDRKSIFNIENHYLTDEYGTKWTIKK